jgi:hypothetical protein
MIVYIETRLGAGLRISKSVESGRRAALKEVGTFNGVQVCREATKEDIASVRSMGGHVPKEAR